MRQKTNINARSGVVAGVRDKSLSLPSEVAFIDPAIDDLPGFLAGLRPDIEAVLLSPSQNALPQIAKELRRRGELEAIHIVAHGAPGQVSFSSGALTLETVEEHAADLAKIGAALDVNGSLLLWSCETGSGGRGSAFIRALSSATRVDVVSTKYPVGSPSMGGSWEIYARRATAQAPLTPEGMATYAGLMANNNATIGMDTISQTSGDDTLTVTATNQIQAADLFDGAGGNNSIVIGAAGAGVSVDLSAAGTDGTHGFHNYEGLTFANTSGTSTATLNAAQFGTGLISNSLAVTGTASNQAVVINSATNFSAAGWTFFGWTAGTDAITINGTSASDTITGSSQADVISGGGGADVLTGGLGADIFVIGAVADLATGEVIDGTAEAVTIDTLRLNAAGTYDLSGFTTISNIDALALNVNAAGFNVTVSDSQVSTADADGNGTGGDLQISASVAMTNGVTINASGLTGTNRMTVVGTNLGGADTIKGGAGADVIDSGAGNDVLVGRAGNDTLTGGAGTDTVDYSQDGGTGAVSVNLITGSATDTFGNTDTLSGIENLTGTNFNDTFIASVTDGLANAFSGGIGLDTVDYSASTNALTVNLSTGSATGTNLGTDTLTSIDIVKTGSGADILTAAASGSTFFAGAGIDTITGGAATDTIDAGDGNDTITGGGGVDILTGGLGADVFVIGAVADLAAGEVIDGTAEAGTLDTLRLNAAGTYNLSTFTTISHIDSIAFNAAAAGFNLTVADGQVSTADANGDGTQGDLQVSASVAMGANGVIIDASSLTGTNRIVVDATNLSGADTISGGAGADILNGGGASDIITGGAGNDTITGGAGVDTMIGGLGSDVFVIGAIGDLAAGETINGTAEADGFDVLYLSSAGTYNLSTFTTISNIDAIALGQNAAYSLTVTDSQVSTADAYGDGTGGELRNHSRYRSYQRCCDQCVFAHRFQPHRRIFFCTHGHVRRQ